MAKILQLKRPNVARHTQPKPNTSHYHKNFGKFMEEVSRGLMPPSGFNVSLDGEDRRTHYAAFWELFVHGEEQEHDTTIRYLYVGYAEPGEIKSILFQEVTDHPLTPDSPPLVVAHVFTPNHDSKSNFRQLVKFMKDFATDGTLPAETCGVLRTERTSPLVVPS